MVPVVWVRSPTIVGAGAGDRPESETVLQKSAASLNGVPLVAACLRPQHRPSISRPVGTPREWCSKASYLLRTPG